MIERLYTLAEITGAFGFTLSDLRQRGEDVDGRVLRLLIDDAVARLKDMSRPDAPSWSPDDILGADDIASPND